MLTSRSEAPLRTRSIHTFVGKYLKEAEIVGVSTDALLHTVAIHYVRKGTKLDVVRQAFDYE